MYTYLFINVYLINNILMKVTTGMLSFTHNIDKISYYNRPPGELLIS